MSDIALSVKSLSKQYSNGFQALRDVNLEVKKGEVFALLGPNGAGKTTLISAICGLLRPSSGTIEVFGRDHDEEYRAVRRDIGLVPQELHIEMFETVRSTVSYSRELFGLKQDYDRIDQIIKSMSLWDKRNNQLRQLSGGMKRRVMIAKALAHDPRLLFLDEPTAGVDVELRKSMWEEVDRLRDEGVTIVLTTHYIEEAEKMADTIGVINEGQLILSEDKGSLMKKMSNKQMVVELDRPLEKLPSEFKALEKDIHFSSNRLCYSYDSHNTGDSIVKFIDALKASRLKFSEIDVKKRNLEEIFVELVEKK